MQASELRSVLVHANDDLGRIRNQLKHVLQDLERGVETERSEKHLRQMEIRARTLFLRTQRFLQQLGVDGGQ